jgi:DNA-binding Lrp family transcriptional regulator
MGKSSKKKIERDEKKVLNELLKDSSQSINVISSKLGFSRQKVWRIIKRLRIEKTVWSYTAIVNSEKIGMKTFILLGKRNPKPLPKKMIDLAIYKKLEKLAKSKNCILDDTFYLNGEYDFISTFKACSLNDAKKYQEEFNGLYRGYIEKTMILEVIFPLRLSGTLNPDINKFSEYF